MTPTTKDATSEVPAGDLPDIERQVERRENQIEELRSREDRLDEAVATKIADGANAENLRGERRAVREKIEDLEAALETLESRATRLRELREHAEAIVEDLAGEAEQEAESFDARADEALADLRAAIQRCEDVVQSSRRQRNRRRAVRLLAQKYALEEPDTPSVPGTTGDDRLREMVTLQPVDREGRSFTGANPVVWAPEDVVELLNPEDG